MAMATAVSGTSTLQRHFLLGSSSSALGFRQARPLLLRSISAKLGLKDEGKLPAEERVLPAANALAAAALAAMAAAPSPAAAREIAALAEAAAADSDSRGLAVLGVLLPAIGWVLFNILRPALNQLDQMKASKGFVAAIGGAAAAAAAVGSMVVPPQAEAVVAAAAREIGSIAADESDNRGLLLLVVILPALGWVVFNILKPALNQFQNMKK